MGLTAKQLIFSVASGVAGGSIVLLLYRYIGLTPSVYVAIPVVAPIALGLSLIHILKSDAMQRGMKESEYIRLLMSQKPNDYPEIRILLRDLINAVSYTHLDVYKRQPIHFLGRTLPKKVHIRLPYIPGTRLVMK